MSRFDVLPLDPATLRNLKDLGYEAMTPIQEKALPPVFAGKDVLAQAKTGSGKTAAFGLGLLAQLDGKLFRPQALIICPTRELAEQVGEAIRKLARAIPNVKILTLCGGTPEYFQEASLRHGAHIVVGTPGRLGRLLRRKHLDLSFVKMLVLDEADRMLEMGFYDDVMNIRSYAPEDIQILLFSATFPEDIRRLAASIQRDPVEVTVDTRHEAETIKQMAFEVFSHSLEDKVPALVQLLSHYHPKTSLVFCKLKDSCSRVALALRREGFAALAIHGDLNQSDRTLALTKFSNGSCAILVATDVVARGLDVPDVAAVINFDLPHNAETYVHRIGRTGRAGKEGMALSLYTQRQDYDLDDIADFTGQECQRLDLEALDEPTGRGIPAPMQTVMIRAGKKQKIRPGDILGALIKDAGIPADAIGKITILPMRTYVAVVAELCDDAIMGLNNGKLKGRRVTARRA